MIPRPWLPILRQLRDILKPFVPPVIICAAIIAVFFQYLDVFFCLDDFDFLEQFFYGHLSSGPDLWNFILHSRWGILRPVDAVYWFICSNAFGFDPLPYNVLRMAIFAGIGILLFLITVRLTVNRAVSLFSVLIFVLHSIHADTFSAVGISVGLLGVLFFVLSFWFFIVSVESGQRWQGICSLGCYVLAQLSWEATIVLPAFLCAYLVFIKQTRSSVFILRRLLAFAVVALVFLGTVMFKTVSGGSTVHNFYQPISTGVFLDTFGYFLRHAFGPLFSGINGVKAVLIIVLLALLLVRGLSLKETRGAVLFSISAFLIGYLPFVAFRAWIINPHDLWMSLLFLPVGFILPLVSVLSGWLARQGILPQTAAGILICPVLISSVGMLKTQRGETRPFFHIAEQRKTQGYLKQAKNKLGALPDNSNVYLLGVSASERKDFRLHVGIPMILDNPTINVFYIKDEDAGKYRLEAGSYILDLKESS